MRRVWFLLVLLLLFSFVQAQEKADRAIFEKFLKYAEKEKITEKENGERISSIARFFLDTPYVSSTLEGKGPESLKINLRELDCTTFVENVLALFNVLKEANQDFETYKRILLTIRYRDGVINGYPSRLHYTTDWLVDNQHKGFIELVKMGRASRYFTPSVNFMSTHPNSYAALKANPDFLVEIAKQEARIHGFNIKYLPKEKLSEKASFIHTGDIVTITSGVAGLDFAHLGFAIRRNGVVYLLHASSSGKKVMISSQNLKDYLSDIKNHTGIVVARPL